MSPIINAVVAYNRTMARRYDSAIEQGLHTTELFPTFMPGHAYLGLAYLEAGKPREAIAALQESQKLQDITVIFTWLIRAHLAAGDTAEAARLIATLEKRGRREYLPSYYMAALHAHSGQLDRAFDEMNRALDERTGAMVWLAVDPGLDPMRKDPRFAKLIARRVPISQSLWRIILLDHLHDLRPVHHVHHLLDLFRRHRHACKRTDLQNAEEQRFRQRLLDRHDSSFVARLSGSSVRRRGARGRKREKRACLHIDAGTQRHGDDHKRHVENKDRDRHRQRQKCREDDQADDQDVSH
jgi:tetratricopeptide (TPR) repeat protein